MPNVGPLELAVVAIIALVIFGPKRLPELGKSLGKGIREFKGSISGDDESDPRAAIEAANREPEASSPASGTDTPAAKVATNNHAG
jgi:sec-independent protein translocase protein TatA